MSLIDTLQNRDLYDHQVTQFHVMETHISWVLLTGPFAYKLKKPVNLGFLDFTTLESRKHFCEEEVRINQRLAPQLYLGVIPITGSFETPEINGKGQPFEYAIKMVQFPEENRLDHLFEKAVAIKDTTRLNSTIDELASLIADFHQRVDKVSSQSGLGSPENIKKAVDDCLDPLTGFPAADSLRAWCEAEFLRLKSIMTQRKQDGFIREGHGDLHLANIVDYKGKILPFDAIEFCDDFRWIDVMNEIAFTLMDLEARRYSSLSHRFLNRYLEQTGDYEGVSLLRYYKVYRALVRAKVANIRVGQESPGPVRTQCEKERDDYLSLASRFIQTEKPRLAITHGLSGSGKTWGSQKTLEEWGAIRLRTDVERKRLFGPGLYTQEATDKVYQHLLEQSAKLLSEGYSVIVDGAFLKRSQRDLFAKLADQFKIPFHILSAQATDEELQKRILYRQAQGQDASEADLNVLKLQKQTQESLTEQELQITTPIVSG